MGNRESVKAENKTSDESDEFENEEIEDSIEDEETIELNLGYEFAMELRKQFGDMLLTPLPSDCNPINPINIPKSLGVQLFAIYAESIYYQDDERNREKNIKIDQSNYRLEIAEGLFQESNSEDDDYYVIDGNNHSQDILNYMRQSKMHREKFVQLKSNVEQCKQNIDPIKSKIYNNIAQLEYKLMMEKYYLALLEVRKQYLEGNPDNHLMDLHGIFVRDAVILVEDFLKIENEKLIQRANKLTSERRKCLSQQITIITGRGKHSEGGTPKIKPAIMSYLRKQKLTFWESNEGCLTVKLMYRTN